MIYVCYIIYIYIGRCIDKGYAGEETCGHKWRWELKVHFVGRQGDRFIDLCKFCIYIYIYIYVYIYIYICMYVSIENIIYFAL